MNSLKKLVVSLQPLYPASEKDSKESPPDKSYDNEKDDAGADPSSADPPGHGGYGLPEHAYEQNTYEQNTYEQNTYEQNAAAHTPPGRSAAPAPTSPLRHWCYMAVARPLLLLWLSVSFPFTYFFGADYPSMDTPRAVTPDAGETPSRPHPDEKTALLKEEKILANNIKSPTGSKYIIPPPPRLFPLRRNPDRRRRKKTLILDLDETLIHSLSRAAPRSLGARGPYHMIELKINNMATLYYVYKRPFCDFFLREASKWFDLQIFTASVQEYADPIIDWLEADMVDHKQQPPGSQPRVFTKRYYRSDCTFRPGVGYIKDLSLLFPKEEDLKNVIILDNSPVSYALHEDNAVMIEGWINDQSDRDLLYLLPMLYSLSLCIDVRFVLGLRSGEKSFER